MGVSSSQPVPEPSKRTATSQPPPATPVSAGESTPLGTTVGTHTPKMDDMAASQQLLEEDARALHPSAENVGRSDSKSKMKRKPKSKKAPTFYLSDAEPNSDVEPTPSKQPSPPRSFNLHDINVYIGQTSQTSGTPASPEHIEVPDSQVEPAPFIDAPMSPPMTSSFAAPSSTRKKPKKTYKTSRRSIPADPEQSAIDGHNVNGNADTIGGAPDLPIPTTPSPVRLKRKRARSSVQSAAGENRFEHDENVGRSDSKSKLGRRFDAAEETITVVERTEDPIEDTVTTATPAKRSKKRRNLGPRKGVTLDPTMNEDTEMEEAQAPGRRRPAREAEQRDDGAFSSQDSILTSQCEDQDAEPTPDEIVPQTPGIEPTPEEIASGAPDVGPSSSKRATPKKGKAGVATHDWPASVRNANDTPSANDILPGISSGGDEVPHVSPVQGSSTKKQRKRRKSRAPKSPKTSEAGGASNTSSPTQTAEPRRRFSRKSNVDSTITAAERALNTVRELHQPPDKRKEGEFTQDEEELIRRAIFDYQERHGLDVPDLVAIIHFRSGIRERRRNMTESDLSQEDLQYEKESQEFWDELNQIELTRPLSRIKNHVRARYHTYKSGAWTDEEDEQLKDLMERYPGDCKRISWVMADRAYLDIYNRWKDYGQYGSSRNTSRWSKEEEESLRDAITLIAQKDEDNRAQSGLPSRPVYTSANIDFQQVSIAMGSIRSRIQCTVKWSQMKKRNPPATVNVVYGRGRTPDTDQIPEPTPKKRGSRKSGDLADSSELAPTPKKRGRPRKSDALNISGEPNDSSAVAPTPKKRGRPRKSDTLTPSGKPRSGKSAGKKRRQTYRSESQVVSDDEADADAAGPSKKHNASLRSESALEKDSVDEGHVVETADEVDEGLQDEANAAGSSGNSDTPVDTNRTPINGDESPEQGLESALEKDRVGEESVVESGDEVDEGLEDNTSAAGSSGQRDPSVDLEPDVTEDEDAGLNRGLEKGVAESLEENELAKGNRASTEPERIGDEDEEDLDSVAEPAKGDRPSAEPERIGYDEGEAAIGESNEHSSSVEQEQPSPEETSEAVEQQTESPAIKQVQPEVHRRGPGPAEMRWGDKFDLLVAVAKQESEHEEDINWPALSAAMNQTWSIKTLQAAFKELLGLVADQGLLLDTVVLLLEYLSGKISEEEIEEHYDPAQDQGQNGEVEPMGWVSNGGEKPLPLEDQDYVELSHAEDQDDAELSHLEDQEYAELSTLEEQDYVEPSHLPNTKKKRKLGARDSHSRPRRGSKKRKTTSAR